MRFKAIKACTTSSLVYQCTSAHRPRGRGFAWGASEHAHRAQQPHMLASMLGSFHMLSSLRLDSVHRMMSINELLKEYDPRIPAFCGFRVLVLSTLFVLGVLLQFLGCVLYSNWWPMLTAFFYVLIPMPYMFFGTGSSDSFISSSELELGWVEAGKFLTGFSAVGLVAVPAILMHAEYITFGAMMIELCAAFSIGSMVAVYDYTIQHSYY